MTNYIETFGFVVALALVPFVLVLMTSFTRISIVLTFLRQALSTSVPSTQIIVGLSLILTGYIMHPVIAEISDEVKVVYQEKKTEDVEEKSMQIAEKAWPILKNFMLSHTREKDLELLLEMSHIQLETLSVDLKEVPWYCIIPAFVLSELRCAFFLGFLIFLPFLVIDMIVTSLLMSMGMIMLPPVLISFPFKLLLFVVVDGWRLIVQQVVHSYN